MAETTQNTKKIVQAPKAGETIVIKAMPGQDIVLSEAFEQVDPVLEGSTVLFAFDNGGKVIIDFADLGEVQIPNIILADGTVLGIDEFLASVAGHKEAALEGEGVEPAAGPAAGGTASGGVGSYEDGAGDTIDGVDKLNGLDPRDFQTITVEPIDAQPEEEEEVVSDTVPTVPVDDTITVEEGSIPEIGGNIDLPGVSFQVLDGTFADNASWGADGFGGIVSVNGVTPVGGVITINGAGFSLVVNAATGAYEYRQTDNLLQGGAGQNTQAGPTFAIIAQDGDGSTIGFNLTVGVIDDLPQASLEPVAESSVVLDETIGGEGAGDDEVSGNPFNPAWNTPIGLVSGKWVVDASGSKSGADFEESTKVISLAIDNPDSDLRTTAGEEITLYAEGNGVVTGRAGEEGRVIFAISINNDGKLTVAQYESLEHGNINSNDDSVNLAGKLSALVTVTDGDGDVSTASVAIGAQISFEDDGPGLMSAEANAIVEDEQLNPATDESDDATPDYTAVATGDVSDNGNWGADGFGAVTQFQVGTNLAVSVPSGGSATVYFGQDGTYLGTTSTDPAASLLVNSDGTYEFTLIKNMLISGNGEQPDSLGTVTFTGVDGDGDSATIGLTLQVIDDVPGLMSAEANAIVEDEQLNPATDESDDATPDYTAVATGDVSDNGNWGADGFGAVTQFQVGTNLAVSVPSGGSATVYFGQDGSYLGTTSTDPAASLLVNSDGTYEFTLIKNMLISGNGEQPDSLGTVTFTGVDGDGDSATIGLTLQVIDDVPGLMSAEANAIVEDEQLNPATDESDDATPDYTAVATGDVSDNGNWGADGFGAVTQFQVGTNLAVSVPSGGSATVYFGQDGSYLGTTSTDPAASLLVNSDGTYEFTLIKNMLISGNGEQPDSLGTVTFTGVDGDGDSATIGLTLQVIDDVPGLMSAEANAIVEDEQLNPATDESDDATPDYTAVATGDVSDNGNWGADGFGAVTQFQVGTNLAVSVPSGGSATVYFGQDGSYLGTTSTDPAASLLVNSDGTYEFTLIKNMLISGNGEQPDSLGTVTFTGVDGDGDSATIGLTLQVIDDVPGLMSAEANAIVEDEQLNPATDESDDATPDYTAVATGDVSDNGNWGADGFGAVTQFQVGTNLAVSVPSGGSATVYFGQDGSYLGTTSTDPAASLLVNSDGTYEFTLIKNMLISGNGEQPDSLGTVTFTGVDGDGDSATIGLTLQVIDDVPGLMSAEANAIVEDEQLNPATDESDDATPDYTAVATGDVSDNGNWGADGFGAVTQFQVGTNLAVSVPSGGSATVYFGQDGSYLGTTSTDPAASLLVNSDGTYEFTLIKNMLISGNGEQPDSLGTVTFTGVDGDGDSATIGLTLQVIDDVPGLMSAEANAIVEDEQLNPATDESDDATPDYTAVATGDVSDNGNWGADGFGAVTQFQVGTNLAVSVPSGGSATVYFGQDGTYLGTTSTDPAASLLVNSDGTYEFTLIKNMLISGNGEQPDSLGTVTFTGVDGDGDSATIGLTLQVIDDVPGLMSAEANAIVEDEQLNPATDESDDATPDYTAVATGDVSDNGNWGADGFGAVTQFQVGTNLAVSVPSGGSATVYFGQDGTYLGTTSTDPAASLLVNSDGTYEFTLIKNMLISGNGEQPDSLGTVTFTGVDGDGDSATIGLTLQVIDDVPGLMSAEANAIVEDEQLNPATDESDDATPDYTAVATGDVSDNGNWGADGFGAVTQFQVGTNLAVSVPSGGSATVYFGQDGSYLGTTSTDPAASLLVNSDGTYEFTLIKNMLISGNGEQPDSLGTVTFTGVDGDGDSATIGLTLQVIDDVPGLMSAEANAIVEDEQLNPATDESDDATPDYTAVATGDVSDNGNWGADGFGAVTQFQVGTNLAVSVPSGGSATVYFGQDGTYLGTTSTDPAASLLVNSDGTYEFTLIKNMLISGNGEQPDSLGTVTFTGVDGDGDSATIGLTLQVIDDVPLIDSPDGFIENDANTVLKGLIDYDMGADGLGNISLSDIVTATSGGVILNLTSSGYSLNYTVTTAPNGLDALRAYYIDDNGVMQDVFSLEPNVIGSEGDYKFTLIRPIDQPVPTTTVSFSGINATGPIEALPVGSSLLISDVNLLDDKYINANTGYLGIGNTTLDSGEKIKYEFGTVSGLSISPDEHIVVNNVSLLIFNKDQPANFSWQAYKWIYNESTDSYIETLVGSDSIPVAKGDSSTDSIYVDGGFDTLIVSMSSGGFKVGGLTYESLGDVKDVTLNFDYSGFDADGDGVSGSFDVTITGGDGISSTGQIYSGTAASDHLVGGEGSDNLFGYEGDDSLTGGNENDFLVGGSGSDTMSGGSGSDTFVYNSGDIGVDVDHIADFQVGPDGDSIELHGILQGYSEGVSDLADFVKVEGAGGTATISVDKDGGVDNFTQIATVTYSGDLGPDPLQTMIDNDNIKIS